MSARNTTEKHLLGFGLFGYAWPVLWIAGRILWWIVEAVVVAVVFVYVLAVWLVAHFRSRA